LIITALIRASVCPADYRQIPTGDVVKNVTRVAFQRADLSTLSTAAILRNPLRKLDNVGYPSPAHARR